MPLPQDYQALLMNSTGHYNIIAVVHIVLRSLWLASVQQGRALECAFVILNGTGTVTHCYAYQKYTESL